MREMHSVGLEVQRNPYSYLLSQNEKQGAYNIIPRFIFDGAAVGLASVYYLSRNNELQKLMRFRFSADMIFGVFWRAALTALAADIVSRRMFVNYIKIR